MPRVRKIQRNPRGYKNWFVVDACFLVNRFIPETRAPARGEDRKRIRACMDWWTEIEEQVKAQDARVYVPDICIAESFKVLAKKYYKDKWFKSSQDFGYWKGQLRERVSTPANVLRRANRFIGYHDVESSRDVIVAVDRFYQIYHRHGYHKVSVADLIVVSTAKYLMDFFDASREQIHIITMDGALRDGSQHIGELPNAYDPTRHSDRASVVFE